MKDEKSFAMLCLTGALVTASFVKCCAQHVNQEGLNLIVGDVVGGKHPALAAGVRTEPNGLAGKWQSTLIHEEVVRAGKVGVTTRAEENGMIQGVWSCRTGSYHGTKLDNSNNCFEFSEEPYDFIESVPGYQSPRDHHVCMHSTRLYDYKSLLGKGRPLDVFFIFTRPYATHEFGRNFSASFETFITSLWQSTKRRKLILHAMVDEESKPIVVRAGRYGCLLQQLERLFIYKKSVVEAKLLALKFQDIQQVFANKSREYYSDSLFMMGAYLHHILPHSVRRVLAIDIDTKIVTDLAKLWRYFEHFPEEAFFGLAQEQGPIYRLLFEEFRTRNRNTQVGEPPPGWPGYNSGVLLLDLEKMRASKLYAELLKPKFAKWLTTKYTFTGHLGDQDFYTLLSFEMIGRKLIYTLPCSWNRQLCRCLEATFPDVFDKYYHCEEPADIYHGNCNTPIP